MGDVTAVAARRAISSAWITSRSVTTSGVEGRDVRRRSKRERGSACDRRYDIASGSRRVPFSLTYVKSRSRMGAGQGDGPIK